jgi:hypothetical protein
MKKASDHLIRGFFLCLGDGGIRTPAFAQQKFAGFGAVNEAKKSTKYFSERMNEGGFSRYPSIPAMKKASDLLIRGFFLWDFVHICCYAHYSCKIVVGNN